MDTQSAVFKLRIYAMVALAVIGIVGGTVSTAHSVAAYQGWENPMYYKSSLKGMSQSAADQTCRSDFDRMKSQARSSGIPWYASLYGKWINIWTVWHVWAHRTNGTCVWNA